MGGGEESTSIPNCAFRFARHTVMNLEPIQGLWTKQQYLKLTDQPALSSSPMVISRYCRDTKRKPSDSCFSFSLCANLPTHWAEESVSFPCAYRSARTKSAATIRI